MSEHGGLVGADMLARLQHLENERRALDSALRDRVQSLIETARQEGFDVGFRAGRAVEAQERTFTDDQKGRVIEDLIAILEIAWTGLKTRLRRSNETPTID